MHLGLCAARVVRTAVTTLLVVSTAVAWPAGPAPAQHEISPAPGPHQSLMMPDVGGGDLPVAMAAISAQEQPASFGFEQVVAKAKDLQTQDYEAPDRKPPAILADLNYDGYQRIKFRDEAADGRDGSQFRIHYALQGYLFKQSVAHHLLRDGGVTDRPARPEDFEFHGVDLTEEEADAAEFAGFKITSPLNKAGKFDDVVNFLGASYFRGLGQGNAYGASARGLAIRTAAPEGEEFPHFTEFWIEEAEPGADSMDVYALLDSPSVTGAYHFVITPGAVTEIDVEARLFPRRDIGKMGVAPITSMFDFAPHDRAPGRQDMRPRVHDSEGLMARLKSGEWIWRPLLNPNQLEISSFAETAPRGFGLMQRTRKFSEFQDIGAAYEKRPSVWVEPVGDWGAGQLMLVEIPTQNEFNDNIVTYWQPKEAWKKDEEVTFRYRIYWGNDAPVMPPVAKVSHSASGKSVSNDNRAFAIDFAFPEGADLDDLEAEVLSSRGELTTPTVTALPDGKGVRLYFELKTQGPEVAELRALLKRAGNPVTETWLYRWRPS